MRTAAQRIEAIELEIRDAVVAVRATGEAILSRLDALLIEVRGLRGDLRALTLVLRTRDEPTPKPRHGQPLDLPETIPAPAPSFDDDDY